MLDFDALRNNKISFDELIADLTPDDLGDLTHEMIGTMLDRIAEVLQCRPEDLLNEKRRLA